MKFIVQHRWLDDYPFNSWRCNGLDDDGQEFWVDGGDLRIQTFSTKEEAEKYALSYLEDENNWRGSSRDHIRVGDVFLVTIGYYFDPYALRIIQASDEYIRQFGELEDSPIDN